ncbi:hypothetical protein [Mesorhizobium sp. WSM1497]|uniref:hypothetical protein n=1 Tax=Mesorhizobium sp. WSM1497 TaxID=278153 RepID=UPI000A5245A8|nr:hypothetical protein [Mesorhizobium sp. WSM1497]
MPKSQKTIVIERIFDLLYDPATKTLSRTVVSSTDVQEAKEYCNTHQGTNFKPGGQAFNFMKDIVRGKSAHSIWPERLRTLGWGGQQRTGDGAIFEFVPWSVGTPDNLQADFKPTASTPRTVVQSLSLPLASKVFGRRDESWLLQVAVNLRIVETHLAIGENRQAEIAEVTHLQMDIKLRNVQIDALFLATLGGLGTKGKQALVTVEAKQDNQRILPEQIARQVHAAFKSSEAETVIPLALAAVRGQGIYAVEFKAVRRADLETFISPEFHRDAMFVFMPPVPGI